MTEGCGILSWGVMHIWSNSFENISMQRMILNAFIGVAVDSITEDSNYSYESNEIRLKF